MKFVYLLLASILIFFARGNQPQAMAVLISTILLLRFIRLSKPVAGYFTALIFMLIPTVISVKMNYFFFDVATAFIISLINVAISLIPYMIDRYLSKRTSSALSHLILPVTVLTFSLLLSPISDGGTFGSETYAFAGSLTLMQLVSITGLAGISFLIYWTASIFNSLWERKFSFQDVKVPVLAYCVVVSIVYMFGTIRLHTESLPESTLQVASVTPAPQNKKEMEALFMPLFQGQELEADSIEHIRSTMDKSFTMLIDKTDRQASGGAELICWSEAAGVCFESDEKMYLDQLSRLASKHGVFIGASLGVLMDDFQNLMKSKKPFIQAKLVLLGPDGSMEWEYLKTQLVAWVETGKLVKGDGIIHTDESSAGRISGVICYDMDFPDYIRQVGQLNSRLLLVPSNDWETIKYIHADMAQIRAIENGVAVFRPTSGGLTIAVDAYGRRLGSVDYSTAEHTALSVTLPLSSVNTFYSKFGNWLEWICAIMMLLLISMVISDYVRQKKSKTESKMEE